MRSTHPSRLPAAGSAPSGRPFELASGAEPSASPRRAVPGRVLYVVGLNPSHKFGSLEEQIFLTASALSRQGGLLLPAFTREMPETHLSRYTAAGLSAIALDLREFELGRLFSLLRVIDRHAINIVHWNLYPPANWYVPVLRLLRPRLKHYLTDHNSRPRVSVEFLGGPKGWCRRLYARNYDRVFAVSDFVLSELARQSIWRSIFRYHHFINTDRFKPDHQVHDIVRRSLGCRGEFIILVVAHLIKEKGADVALRALTHLPSDAILWVVGDGPERGALEELTRELGLEGRVRFFGLQSEVCRFMQAADCLVCPSLWQEAAGLVILEAMASGLPVLGSAVGGIPEFVVPDRTGYLFPPGDDLDLAERLTRLYSSRSQLESMREQARAHAVSRFSHQTGVHDALAQYEAFQ